MYYVSKVSMASEALMPSTSWLETTRVHHFGFQILPPRTLVA
jgi:hypothetical protein